MKLHKDGAVEGTPEEIAEYNRLVNGTQTLGPVGGQYRSPSDASNPLLPKDTIKPVITSGGCSIQSDGKGITVWNGIKTYIRRNIRHDQTVELITTNPYTPFVSDVHMWCEPEIIADFPALKAFVESFPLHSKDVK